MAFHFSATTRPVEKWLPTAISRVESFVKLMLADRRDIRHWFWIICVILILDTWILVSSPRSICAFVKLLELKQMLVGVIKSTKCLRAEAIYAYLVEITMIKSPYTEHVPPESSQS